MKKINKDALEKMAKDKNIDKNKVEEIANSYKGKSESELMNELIKIGKNLKCKEEVVSKFKTFLDEDQRKKLDSIMGKISEAEMQDKFGSKKLSSKKSSTSPSSSNTKKVKKVVKKVKKSNNI